MLFLVLGYMLLFSEKNSLKRTLSGLTQFFTTENPLEMMKMLFITLYLYLIFVFCFVLFCFFEKKNEKKNEVWK